MRVAEAPPGGRQQSWPSPAALVTVALVLALAAAGIQSFGRPAGQRGFTLLPGQPTVVVPPAPSPTPPPGLPPLALSHPPRPLGARIGLQVGHWRSEELPDELADLRQQRGGSAGGVHEVDINLLVAQRVAVLLAPYEVTVDILPATVPPGYEADAFIAVHCDINNDTAMRGYKLARYRSSAIPARDDALLAALGEGYATMTGLPPDAHLTLAMTGYYAFNARTFRHAIAPHTPATIVELGFLSNPADRALLAGEPERVAYGLAEGILRFLLLPDSRAAGG